MNPLAVDFLRSHHPLVWGQFTGHFDCGTGWFAVLDYFGYRLVQSSPNFDGRQKVIQVKEKFGELRIYLLRQEPQHVHLAQVCRQMARSLCEICGEPGEFSIGLSAVPEARCDRHVDTRVSPDDALPFELQTLISGREGNAMALKIAYRTMPPLPRLSRVRYPAGDEEATANRQRLCDELGFLMEAESLSNQQLALLCIAQSALDLARESPELEGRIRSRAHLFAKHSGSAESVDAILASWTSQSNGPSTRSENSGST